MRIAEKGKQSIIITDKSTGDREEIRCINENIALPTEILGVFGILEINRSDFLILVTKALNRGMLCNEAVYEISEVLIVDLDSSHLDISFLDDFFKVPGIYFSKYKLWERCPGIYSDAPRANRSNAARAKHAQGGESSEFLFNGFALRKYYSSHTQFGLECIQGYYGSWRNLHLISRRSIRRIGSRYFSRGSDEEGNCSNFVETEQIIENESAYLQLRGSIPIRWKQLPTLKYTPPVEIEMLDTVKSHHKKLLRKYDEEIVYLNLIKEDGNEGKLFSCYKKELDGLSAHHYDFHRNFKKVNFPINFKESRISRFSHGRPAGDDERQKTIIRTNCIDCLDRTNAMQCFIGIEMLEEQVPGSEEHRRNLKTLFCENGNRLSQQYSGTPVLGAHFITDGRKTCRGQLRDGYYSVKRYFVNRVRDRKNQLAYEIISGKTSEFVPVHRAYQSELIQRIIFLISVIMCLPSCSPMVMAYLAVAFICVSMLLFFI